MSDRQPGLGDVKELLDLSGGTGNRADVTAGADLVDMNWLGTWRKAARGVMRELFGDPEQSLPPRPKL